MSRKPRAMTSQEISTSGGGRYALDEINHHLERRHGCVLVLQVDVESGALRDAYLGTREGVRLEVRPVRAEEHRVKSRPGER